MAKTKKKQNNSIEGAIMGFDVPAYGNSQISKADTLFKNLRWYLVSNYRNLLSFAYVEYGLIRTIVDIVVDDGFKGGVEIKTGQLDVDEIKRLQNTSDKEGDIDALKMAYKWARLYGGGAVIIITDQDPSEPLDISAIGPDTPLKFKHADMWELYYSLVNTTDDFMEFNDVSENIEYFDYYGHRLHKSRVITIAGDDAPSFIRPRLRGWGLSCVELFVRSVNQYLKTTDLSFELLDEYKIDVFKMQGLAQYSFTKDGQERIRKRIETANRSKNYQNALVLDKNDDYEQKQVQLTGISEVLSGIRTQVASDLRLPQNKIFGQSSTGFSSGEDDIENYNSRIESTIRSKSKFQIIKILEIRCQKEFGFIPDDLEILFKPLRTLTSEQEENVKNAKFQRLLQAAQAGLITVKEFKEDCNRDNLFPLQIDINAEVVKLAGEGEPSTKLQMPKKGSMNGKL